MRMGRDEEPPQSQKGKSVEIPVPKRGDFDRLLAKAERPKRLREV